MPGSCTPVANKMHLNQADPLQPPPPAQLRVNAPMLELPADALTVTAGEVLRVAPPFVQGAFMVFPVSRWLQ